MATESPADTAPDPKPARKRGRGADPEQTRAELVDAAFESLRHDGISATTSRSIAARAACNQAAIYYHFGGISELFVEALRQSSARRLERYQAQLADMNDIAQMIAAIEQLYIEDRESGHLAVLTEMAGGIASYPEIREGIADATSEWLAFVEERIRVASEEYPFAAAIPATDLADLIFSLVVGLELRSRVDGQQDRAERLFRLAGLAAGFVGSSK